MLNRCRFNQWHIPIAGITRWQFSLALLLLPALAGRPACAAQTKNAERASAEQTIGKVDSPPKAEASVQKSSSEGWNRIVFRLATDLETGNSDAVRKADEELLAIRDSTAVSALVRNYGRLRKQENRRTFVKALGNIPSRESTAALAKCAILDLDGGVRNAASDQLKDRHDDVELYQRIFLDALQSKNVEAIDRAAEAIRRLKFTNLIPSLCHALVTKTAKVTDQRQTYLPLSPIVVEGLHTKTEVYPNGGVYYALVELTGQDFGYDSRAWLRWWSAVQLTQTRPDLTNGRRADEAAEGPRVAEPRAADGPESRQEGAPDPHKLAKEPWSRTFFRLAQWLESGNPDLIGRAEVELPSIRDPEVVPIIMDYMYKVRMENRERLIGVLAQIDDTRASVALANVAILEPTPELRKVAIDHLSRRAEDEKTECQAIFLAGLRSRIQELIDNSAISIAELNMNNLSYALIESLDAPVAFYDKVKIVLNLDGRDFMIGLTPELRQKMGSFGNTTLSHSWTVPVTYYVKLNQQCVLQSLKSLTGQDFGFNEFAWKRWWSAQRSQNANSTPRPGQPGQIKSESDPPSAEQISIVPK